MIECRMRHARARTAAYVERLSPRADDPRACFHRRDLQRIEPVMPNDIRTSPHRCVAIAASMLAAASCSKQQPDQPTAPTPLVQQDVYIPQGAQEIRGKLHAGGINTTYRSFFHEGSLELIIEARDNNTGGGAYEFMGARLTKYRGAGLTSPANVELDLDLAGKIVRARAGSSDASADEIAAIRNRAQLLRSHALTQRTVHEHETK
jgi:hypothetical protein